MPAGRPLKNGVDYFPLDVILDDKFELIEAEHGIKGFGVLIKIYQKIYANNYWAKFDKKAILVFSNRINVDINSINAIINSCSEWDIFDHELFKKFEILTSKGIQKRFFEIVKRRKVVEVCREFLLIDLEINAYKNLINVDHNQQRKGKERKVKGNDIQTPISPKPENQPKSFKRYLKEKIIENNFIDSKDKIIEFYEYRMDMPKAKQYKSEKGINGLFRDLIGCRDAGLVVSDCLEIAMERGWQTAIHTYFKNLNGSPQKMNGCGYKSREEKNLQACMEFISEAGNER